MCCFSGPVQEVSGTRIFARRIDKDMQYLVYSMHFKSLDDLAMILPIPTPEGSAEDAVKFISLKEYENFFDDMHAGFPEPAANGEDLRDSPPRPLALPEPKLAVVDVGSFEASFVPSIKDFARLDERFRLPEGTWDALPAYKKFGFAVFKLKKGEFNVHPMAFLFPTSLKRELFFPTVHIHDGKVHDKAAFDHDLYCQLSEEAAMYARGWRESPQPAGMFMDKKKAGKLIDPDAHAYKRRVYGRLKNQDTLV